MKKNSFVFDGDNRDDILNGNIRRVFSMSKEELEEFKKKLLAEEKGLSPELKEIIEKAFKGELAFFE